MGSVKPIQNQSWTVPILLLFLIILAFGLLIPTLGYYFDDWPVIYMIQSKGDFWDFYQYDRPFSAWTFVLSSPILGARPFLWHGFTLILRWLTTLGMWWTLKQLWPAKSKTIAWIAMVFAVHPVFTQQSIAVAYSQHFITYGLYFFSCGTMLVAVKYETRAWLYWMLSIITAAVHIFTMEYFWGLEFVRPLLFWIYYTNRADSPRNRIRKTIFRSLPYLGLLVAAVLLRQYFFQTFFVENPDPNTLRLVDQFKSAPIDAIKHFVVMVLRDLVFISVTTWEKTLHPGLIDLQTNSIVLSWALFLIVIVVLWFCRNYLEAQNDDQFEGGYSSWPNQALMLGGAIFFLGTFPVWMTSKQITVGMYSDRFALPAMWGISILMVSLPSKIGISYKSKSILLSILIGLSIGSHFRISNDFRWEWIRQKRFYWQLYWRAPEVEPGTAFFADGTVFTYVADYPLAFALNTLYDSAGQGAQLPYWFFELDSGFYWYPQEYLKGRDITGSLRNYSFQSDSLDSLLIDYDHRSGNCLWILDEQDSLINELTDLTREALPISHLDRIGMDGEVKSFPPVTIFGSEPKRDWCYYFQKADAAHQANDLDEIIQIDRTVHQLGFEPNNKLEWLPFIDTYAANEYWEEASQITLEKFEVSPITKNTFCAYWESYYERSDEASKDRGTITNVLETLECR